MFPTGVGMNRWLLGLASRHDGVPHGRGDEPRRMIEDLEAEVVFPTGVGMNRKRQRTSTAPRCVPHGRGDEP